MKAVLYTGGCKPWADVLGDRPWALLPVAGRPLLSYWLELCLDLGISDVQIILGRDAEYVEMFCGNGEKWGLSINYSFIRAEDDPQAYLSRDPQRWSDGLLYIGDAVFPRRRPDFTVDELRNLLRGCCVRHHEHPAFFASCSPECIRHFIRSGRCAPDSDCVDPCGGTGVCRTPNAAGLEMTFIRDVTHYYRLNMDIVNREMERYVSSGYSSGAGFSIGTNVITPPSVTLTPPLAVGNDCRLGALASIGPGAVISDHVLIDRQCEISDSIILSDTYVGRNLEIRGKIVAGNRIVDPEDGTWLDIEDPWLVAQTRPQNYLRDFLRAVFSWEFSLLLLVVQTLPFLILYGLIRLMGRGRFVRREIRGIGGRVIAAPRFVSSVKEPSLLLMAFCGMSLDRFPQLILVLRGHLWLCGQVPKKPEENIKDDRRYFPAVFSYSDAFIEIDRQMDALYYAHTRSLAADLRILRHALFARLVEVEFLSETAAEDRA